MVVQGHLTEWHDHFLPAIPTKTKLHKLIFYTPEVKKNMYGTSDPTAIKETKTQKTKYVKQKNVWDKKLPDISVYKTNLVQGLQK